MSQQGPLWQDRVWRHGVERPGQLVTLAIAVVLTLVAIDVLLVGQLSYFFDLGFVTACLGLALLVRPREFLLLAALPPLVMVAVFALLAPLDPDVVAEPGDNVVQALVSGIAHHSGALVAGYALFLGCLVLRHRSLRRG
ncbi:DUF6542 domain-containing protein [Nocardioides gansuensis]|uniref:DUF6542 domain-containing protein n=1 Tax=Nocardioides gansuensis TaxID=2138300 RepID=UPI0010579DB5|nr:DUF6542 domain-containing protein [Nocardioides gansuensis]